MIKSNHLHKRLTPSRKHYGDIWTTLLFVERRAQNRSNVVIVSTDDIMEIVYPDVKFWLFLVPTIRSADRNQQQQPTNKTTNHHDLTPDQIAHQLVLAINIQ